MSRWALSPSALEDVELILEYVENESGAEAADRLLVDFQSAFALLAESPHIGTLRERLTGPTVRWWGVHKYLVLYRADARPLRVLRVIHGARDIGKALGRR